MSQSQLKRSEASIRGGNAVFIKTPKSDEGGGSSKPDLEDSSPGSSRIKKLALDLLSALCGKRIDYTRIKFAGPDLCNRGGNGDVVMATLADDSDDESQPERLVAVKKLRLSLELDIEKCLKAFVTELRILDKLCHPHIATIIGFVEDIENKIAWMIFPWEANGNIRQFLRSGTWEIPERVSLIRDVAAGLEYLHNFQPPICHGDLKSLNVLVNDSYRAFITDFGSARFIGAIDEVGEGRSDHQPTPVAPNHAELQGRQSWRINLTLSEGQLTLSGPGWTLRWAAPEVLGGQHPDLASDVWAFGWVCWEIITDNIPFPDINNEVGIVVMVVRGQLPPIDAHDRLSQIRSLCNIMQKCWEPEPNERLSVIQCKKLLEWISFLIPVMKSRESEIQSAALLTRTGEMYRVQGQNDKASDAFQKGLVIARSTGDKAAIGGIMVQLGQLGRAQSKYTQADDAFSEAMEIYKGIGDGLGQASALLGRGNIHWTWSKHDEAERFYTDALELYERVGGDFGRANALVGLGHIHHTRSKHGEAEICYTQALAINISIGYILGQVNALFGVGRTQMIRSEYAEAEQSFTQALELSTSTGNRFNRASASLGLGDAYRARSKYAEAKESFSGALETFKAAGNRLGQASALLGLGNVYHAQGSEAKAEEFCSKALEIYTDVGFGMGRGNALCGLGSIHCVKSEHAKAESYYVEALNVYTGLKHSFGRGEALLGLGDTNRERLKYAEAEKSYAEALEIFTSQGNRSGHANALRGLGYIHRARSKYDQAEELYKESLRISTSLEDEVGQADSTLELGELRIRQARYAEAKTFIERAAEISERLEYRSGQDQSEKLLLNVLEAETPTAELQPLHLIPAITTTERPIT